jgi:hypothetical protein
MDVKKLFSKDEGQSYEDIVPTAPTALAVDDDWVAPKEIPEAPVWAQIAVTQPSPLRHPLSARFHQLLKEVGELHDRKQKDYGTAEDPFANVRGATEFGLPAPMGAFIAMSDIMNRIKSFCKNGKLENESLDNALRDMAVYSLIALVLFEEESQKDQTQAISVEEMFDVDKLWDDSEPNHVAEFEQQETEDESGT